MLQNSAIREDNIIKSKKYQDKRTVPLSSNLYKDLLAREENTLEFIEYAAGEIQAVFENPNNKAKAERQKKAKEIFEELSKY